MAPADGKENKAISSKAKEEGKIIHQVSETRFENLKIFNSKIQLVYFIDHHFEYPQFRKYGNMYIFIFCKSIDPQYERGKVSYQF